MVENHNRGKSPGDKQLVTEGPIELAVRQARSVSPYPLLVCLQQGNQGKERWPVVMHPLSLPRVVQERDENGARPAHHVSSPMLTGHMAITLDFDTVGAHDDSVIFEIARLSVSLLRHVYNVFITDYAHNTNFTPHMFMTENSSWTLSSNCREKKGGAYTSFHVNVRLPYAKLNKCGGVVDHGVRFASAGVMKPMIEMLVSALAEIGWHNGPSRFTTHPGPGLSPLFVSDMERIMANLVTPGGAYGTDVRAPDFCWIDLAPLRTTSSLFSPMRMTGSLPTGLGWAPEHARKEFGMRLVYTSWAPVSTVTEQSAMFFESPSLPMVELPFGFEHRETYTHDPLLLTMFEAGVLELMPLASPQTEMAAGALSGAERFETVDTLPRSVYEQVCHAHSLLGEGYDFTAIYVFPEESEVRVRARLSCEGGRTACPFGRVHPSNGVGIVMKKEEMFVVCYSAACTGIQRMEWSQWASPNGWVYEGEVAGSKTIGMMIKA